MRYDILGIFITLFLCSCTSKECTSYEGYDWCYEKPSELKVQGSSLYVSNAKDGLYFTAEIKSDCDGMERDISAFDNYFEVQKTDELNFKVYYNEVVTRLSLTDTHVLQGIGLADTKDGKLCVTWTGVNKRKALRLIRLLLK